MNNDLISRSALVEVIPEAVADEESNQNEIAYAEGWNDCLESFCSIVKYAPAVDAEPVRHGLWRMVNVPKRWGGNTIRCSECNTGGTKAWNYCPNCGAKMDGDVNAAD